MDGTSAFRAATAAGETWSDTAKDVLARLDTLPGANLGVVYVNSPLAGDLSSVATLLRSVTGIDDWIGGVGLGVCGAGVEHFDVPAISVMTARLPEDSFRLLSAGPPAEGNGDLDPAVAAWIDERQGRAEPLVGLVHADPRNPGIADALSALSERTGAFLVGGLASDKGGQAVLGGAKDGGGITGVLFGSDVGAVTAHSQGCSPIGPTRVITSCADGIIREIDDRPAMDVFKEDIGDILAHDLRRVAGYIFAAVPVPGTDTGDYMVRNFIGLDPTRGWMAIAHPVSPGDRILFTRRDRDTAVADLDRMLAGIRRRLVGRKPAAAIYVSCVARGPNLFGPDANEIRQVQTAIGDDVPLVGFFANGEILHDRLYGYTAILTLLM